MKNCSTDPEIVLIQNTDDEINIGYYQVPFLGTINVFTLLFETSAQLSDKWEDICSTIAAYFQSSLPAEKEFERWNVYLFYICMEHVDKSLQYKLENDRFASRKILINDFIGELDEQRVEDIISQHITNADLDLLDSSKSLKNKFIKEPIIEVILSGYQSGTAKVLDEADL